MYKTALILMIALLSAVSFGRVVYVNDFGTAAQQTVGAGGDWDRVETQLSTGSVVYFDVPGYGGYSQDLDGDGLEGTAALTNWGRRFWIKEIDVPEDMPEVYLIRVTARGWAHPSSLHNIYVAVDIDGDGIPFTDWDYIQPGRHFWTDWDTTPLEIAINAPAYLSARKFSIAIGWHNNNGTGGSLATGHPVISDVRVELLAPPTIAPEKAVQPDPLDDAVEVFPSSLLKWAGVVSATSYNVYFGDNEADVQNAADPAVLPGRGNLTATEFNPASLEYNKTYYWRVDTVNSVGVTKGDIWSFTTAVYDAQLTPYLRGTKMWHSQLLGRAVPLKMYFHKESETETPAPIIVYIQNSAAPRIGTEPDNSILLDFIADKYLVVTVDFGNDARAVSPKLEQDLWDLRGALYGHTAASILSDLNIRRTTTKMFFVPSGFRVAKDIVFWEHDKHGQHGTAEYLINKYNTHVAGVIAGRTPVSSLSEMVDRSGQPLDLKLRLDVVYPSMPAANVPVMMLEHTNIYRDPSTASGSDATFRRFQSIGFALRGYAFANVDHCHCPVWRAYYNFPEYTMQHYNGMASATAAVRYLNAHSSQYNLDMTRIGGAGHSRASYGIMRLSDPANATTNEDNYFEGFPQGSPQPQPWAGFGSQISAGYYSMGVAYWRQQYVKPNSVPVMVGCGELEESHIVAQHGLFVKHLELLDVEHAAFLMQGLAHDMPMGFDEALGVDRYELFCKFFDYHLNPQTFDGPTVLYVTPPAGKEGVSGKTPIAVQFAGRINTATIVSGGAVKVRRVRDGADVQGVWQAGNGQTKFIFTPQDNWQTNEQYRVEITSGVLGQDGRPIDEVVSLDFNPFAGNIADLNGDGKVDMLDFTILGENWLQEPQSQPFIAFFDSFDDYNTGAINAAGSGWYATNITETKYVNITTGSSPFAAAGNNQRVLIGRTGGTDANQPRLHNFFADNAGYGVTGSAGGNLTRSGLGLSWDFFISSFTQQPQWEIYNNAGLAVIDFQVRWNTKQLRYFDGTTQVDVTTGYQFVDNVWYHFEVSNIDVENGKWDLDVFAWDAQSGTGINVVSLSDLGFRNASTSLNYFRMWSNSQSAHNLYLDNFQIIRGSELVVLPSDINRDGIVDFLDLKYMSENWLNNDA